MRRTLRSCERLEPLLPQLPTASYPGAREAMEAREQRYRADEDSSLETAAREGNQGARKRPYPASACPAQGT